MLKASRLIKKGNFIIDLDLEKKTGVSVMEFHLEGHAEMNCDRCMEIIQLPVKGDYRMLLKYGDEEESNEEILYIDPEMSTLHLAKLIYEYILLSVPIVKVYNCEDEVPRPCNMEVLNKLNANENVPSEEASVWDSLKGINFEDN